MYTLASRATLSLICIFAIVRPLFADTPNAPAPPENKAWPSPDKLIARLFHAIRHSDEETLRTCFGKQQRLDYAKELLTKRLKPDSQINADALLQSLTTKMDVEYAVWAAKTRVTLNGSKAAISNLNTAEPGSFDIGKIDQTSNLAEANKSLGLGVEGIDKAFVPFRVEGSDKQYRVALSRLTKLVDGRWYTSGDPRIEVSTDNANWSPVESPAALAERYAGIREAVRVGWSIFKHRDYMPDDLRALIDAAGEMEFAIYLYEKSGTPTGVTQHPVIRAQIESFLNGAESKHILFATQTDRSLEDTLKSHRSLAEEFAKSKYVTGTKFKFPSDTTETERQSFLEKTKKFIEIKWDILRLLYSEMEKRREAGAEDSFKITFWDASKEFEDDFLQWGIGLAHELAQSGQQSQYVELMRKFELVTYLSHPVSNVWQQRRDRWRGMTDAASTRHKRAFQQGEVGVFLGSHPLLRIYEQEETK